MIARSLGENLFAQARFLIDLQHVNADVLDVTGNRLLQRILPALPLLVRKPRNQINADVANSSVADPRNLRLALQPRVQSSNRRRLAIDKRLHPKADAVHAQPQQFVQRLVAELPRSALERDLSVPRQVELTTQTLKHLAELRRAQQTG